MRHIGAISFERAPPSGQLELSCCRERRGGMTMSVEGEICAYVRGARDKCKAIKMAATFFCKSEDQIAAILRSYGLIGLDGRYIEPMRMTGKEQTMKGKDKDQATFLWSPNRVEKLRELYQEGATVPAIAKYFGVDVSKVDFAVSKYNVCRIFIVPTGSESPADPVAAPPQDAPQPENQGGAESVPASDPEPPPEAARSEPDPAAADQPVAQDFNKKFFEAALGPVRQRPSLPEDAVKNLMQQLQTHISNAVIYADNIVASFLDDNKHQAFYDLGRQSVRLLEAEKIIRKILEKV